MPGFTGFRWIPAPLPFQVADPELLRQALAGAGLKDVRVETVTQQMAFRSGSHMWDWVVNSNPLAAMLVADLTSAQEERGCADALDGMLRERSGGHGPRDPDRPEPHRHRDGVGSSLASATTGTLRDRHVTVPGATIAACHASASCRSWQPCCSSSRAPPARTPASTR